MNIRAVRDESGALLCYEGTVVDISEDRAYAEETAALLARIDKELRTPLFALSAALAALHQEYGASLPAGAHPLMDAVVRNSTQALQSVEALNQSATTRAKVYPGPGTT
jgi:signal transduction histidine kinase